MIKFFLPFLRAPKNFIVSFVFTLFVFGSASYATTKAIDRKDYLDQYYELVQSMKLGVYDLNQFLQVIIGAMEHRDLFLTPFKDFAQWHGGHLKSVADAEPFFELLNSIYQHEKPKDLPNHVWSKFYLEIVSYFIYSMEEKSSISLESKKNILTRMYDTHLAYAKVEKNYITKWMTFILSDRYKIIDEKISHQKQKICSRIYGD